MASSTRSDYQDDISIDDDIDSERGYVSEDESYYSYDAEAEWEESKAQMSALFSLVIFPFVGRWLGKKFSFWLWSRYLASPNSLPLPSSLLSTQWLNSMKRDLVTLITSVKANTCGRGPMCVDVCTAVCACACCQPSRQRSHAYDKIDGIQNTAICWYSMAAYPFHDIPSHTHCHRITLAWRFSPANKVTR
ncbi:hypothetical protein BX666DRAFT_667504 [Dichotomocladium elegans]|nr:hypothetical protein BX666DRAFT_667504 [Dichotomocladium elegans]